MMQIGKVIAGSSWDSGTHLNFFCGISEKNQYALKTLDKVLTKEQISSLEILIATCVSSFLSAEEKKT